MCQPLFLYNSFRISSHIKCKGLMPNDSFFHLVNTSFHLLENIKMKREQRLPLDCRSSWKCDSPGLASGEKHQHRPSVRPKLKPSAQPDCDVAITFHHIKCVITVCRQVMVVSSFFLFLHNKIPRFIWAKGHPGSNHIPQPPLKLGETYDYFPATGMWMGVMWATSVLYSL